MKGKTHLTSKEDFARIYRVGASWAGSLMVIRIAPNNLTLSRYGFSISKKTGSAVTRNKLRRRLREIIRNIELKLGWDIVITLRPKANEVRFSELRDSLKSLLRRAELIKNEEFCLKTD